MVACKDKNDLPLGVRWRRVVEYCGGSWYSQPGGTFTQDVFAYYLSVSCNHCSKPICVEACPTAAMSQDEKGIVSVDPRKCMGCQYCEWACPYNAPQLLVAKGVMSKCDFCRDLLEKGESPACVAACPTRALQFGELEDLQQKYDRTQTIAPLPEEHYTEPGFYYFPHKSSKPAGGKSGFISNPEENNDA